jgi:hypothetical protein
MDLTDEQKLLVLIESKQRYGDLNSAMVQLAVKCLGPMSARALAQHLGLN